jgi:hypothetical protein
VIVDKNTNRVVVATNPNVKPSTFKLDFQLQPK